jgi:Cys-tRNA(Pro)/Cys-tRNA(Cys) deacylase
MTTAIRAVEKAKIQFDICEYRHDSRAASYGLEAAAALGVPIEHVFKTLIVKLDTRELVAALVPVHKQLDLKTLASVLGVKKVEMADVAEAERVTGYVTGGISPLGQRKRLRTVADTSILHLDRVFVSAGRRGMDMALHPNDLLHLCGATTAPIAR